MEFRFNVARALRPDASGFVLFKPKDPSIKTREVSEVIDCMGGASARAQGLGAVITTTSRFFGAPDNKIYLKVEGTQVMGMLKTGYRRLFYNDHIGRIVELFPLCLLDFYIHESKQRHGYGKELYERMLEHEGLAPSKIAIDRPSVKLLNFMQKHYGLKEFVPQTNFFVIFNEFFLNEPARRATFSGLPKIGPEIRREPLAKREEDKRPKPPSNRHNDELKNSARNILGGNTIERNYLKTAGNNRLPLETRKTQSRIELHQLEYKKFRAHPPPAPWGSSGDSYYSTTSSSYGYHYRRSR